MAGTRQRNAFNALMQSYGTYQEALEAQRNSEGSSQRKYNTYKESIAYQKEQLSVAWEELVLKLDESSAIKRLYRVLTFLVEQADKFIPLAIGALSSAPSIFSKIQSPLISALKRNTEALNANTASNGGNVPGAGEAGFFGEKRKSLFTKKREGNGKKDDEGYTGKFTIGGMLAQAGTVGLTNGLMGGGFAGNIIDDLTGTTPYETTGDNVLTGLFSAGGSIIGNLLGGPIAGAVGSVLADGVASLIKWETHQSEIERADRVKQAKEEQEALSKIQASLDNTFEVVKKDRDEWDASDWKNVNDFINKVKTSGLKVDGLDSLSESSLDETKMNEIMSQYIIQQANNAYRAGEEDRANIRKEFETEEAKALNTIVDDQEYYNKFNKTREEVITSLRAAREELDAYTEAVENAKTQAAFYSSGVASMTSQQIAVATLDRVIWQIAQERKNEVYDENGELKSDVRDDIIMQLRQDDRYGSLFNGKTKSAGDLRYAKSLYAKVEDYDALKKAAQSKDAINEINKVMKYTYADGDNIISIIDSINNADPSGITTIAHGLNMTVDQFEDANKDGAFDWLTAGDVLDGLDKFREKLSGIGEIFSGIVTSSKLSQENLDKIVKTLPFLGEVRGGNGQLTGYDFSKDNVLNNILDMYTNGANSTAMRALAGITSASAASDSSIFGLFKGTVNKEDFTDEKIYSEIIGVSSFASLSGKAREAIAEKFWKLVSDTVGDLGLYEEFKGYLTEYATNSYDSEIQNLQSIIDSLEDVNKQRQNELDLIKAKQNLENAQKEKKRVYRAGIGWTYEADQEAIREAQERVDELDRKRTQEDLQYQIDLLEQQKEILQSIDENKKLQELTNIVEGYLDRSGQSGVIPALFGLDSDAFVNQMKQAVLDSGGNFGKVDKEIDDAAKEEAVKAYETAFGKFDEKYNKKSVLTDALNDEGYFGYSEAAKKYNEDVENLRGLRAAAAAAGVDVSSWNVPEKKENVSETGTQMYYAHYRNLYDNNGHPNGQTLQSKTNEMIADGEEITSEEAFNKHMKGTSGVDKYYLLSPNGKAKRFNPGAQDIYSYAKDNLENGMILVNDWANYSNDRAVYKDFDGKLRWAAENEGDIGRFDKDLAKFVTEDNAYATGTTSFSGGRTLINENGLEAIITPEGTLTSLPSKSGIIPADLTKNLWALGEIAPNLIARLGGMNFETNENSRTEDNSTNIGTLNATFNTQDGFDGAAFLRDLQREVRLTQNNH